MIIARDNEYIFVCDKCQIFTVPDPGAQPNA